MVHGLHLDENVLFFVFICHLWKRRIILSLPCVSKVRTRRRTRMEKHAFFWFPWRISTVEIRLILCKFPDMRYPVKDRTHIRELFLWTAGGFVRSERFVSLGQVAGLFQFEIRGREPRSIPFSATDIRYAITDGAVVRHDTVYPYYAPVSYTHLTLPTN